MFSCSSKTHPPKRIPHIAALLLGVVVSVSAAQTAHGANASGRCTPETAGIFAGGESILTNGGFEDGVTGWSPANGQALASGPDVAHGGNACMTGEVTEPNRALFLRRSISAKRGSLLLRLPAAIIAPYGS